MARSANGIERRERLARIAALVVAVAAPTSRASAQIPAGWPGLPAAAAPSGAPAAAAAAEPSPSAAFPMIPTERPVFEVVRLKYADVSEVVGVLTAAPPIKSNDIFVPQEPAFGSASLGGSAGGYAGGGYTGGGYVGSGIATPSVGATSSPGAGSADPLGQTVDDTFSVDRRLNAIVLKGSAARVAELKEQIAKLDVAVASVELQTEFVELTETGARNLGLDFTNGNGQIAVASYGIGASSSSYGAGGSGAISGLVAGLQAAISAQVAKGNGRIVSRPRIAAQNGSTARIVTGDALPILTSIALSGVNAVQQQVQYVNVGVTLQIAPRLTDDGYVTSRIFAEVSSVTGYSQGYPTISQREAETSATVKIGEPFVIGGLTQESRLSQKKKVPLIGDMPLVGTLFRSENSSTAKTELYIVVTPRLAGRDPAPVTVSERR